MARWNQLRYDEFDRPINWEDEIDPEANAPYRIAQTGLQYRHWVPAAAGAAASSLLYWRGNPISEESLPVEQIVPEKSSALVVYGSGNQLQKRTHKVAFGPYTSTEPYRYRALSSAPSPIQSTASNLLNLRSEPTIETGTPQVKGVKYRDLITTPNKRLRNNARQAVQKLTMPRYYRRTTMVPRVRYNRRYGAGKYRRGPRNLVRFGWSGRKGELKYSDVAAPTPTASVGLYYASDFGTSNATNNDDCILLNGLAQGDDNTQRIGRQVRNHKLNIRLHIIAPTGATAQTPYRCRTMVVIDRQPNSAQLTVTDLVMAPADTQFRNLNFRERFKCLYDKVHIINPAVMTTNAAVTTMQGTAKFLQLNFKLKGMVTTYSGTGTGAGTISKNAIYLLTMGDLPGNRNATPSLSGVPYISGMISRLRYTDE